MANEKTNDKLERLLEERQKAEAALHKAQARLKAKTDALTKEADRQRTHRLCTRGGHLEKFLEEPELLTDEDVCKLIDYLFTSNRVNDLVQDMLRIRRGEASGSVDVIIESAITKLKQMQNRSTSAVTT